MKEACGYQLLLSSESPTGYLGVRKKSGGAHGGSHFEARGQVAGPHHSSSVIGKYKTVVEAAVAVAKHAAGELAPMVEDTTKHGGQPTTAEVTEAGGYQLWLSRDNSTGYKGVRPVMAMGLHNGTYAAQRSAHGQIFPLGVFNTPVEAAIAYAKHAAEYKHVQVEAEEGDEEANDEAALQVEGLCGYLGCNLPARHAGLHRLPVEEGPRSKRKTREIEPYRDDKYVSTYSHLASSSSSSSAYTQFASSKRKGPSSGRGIGRDGIKWVACSRCTKWRAMDPRSKHSLDLTGQWYCENNMDPRHNRCEAVEASEKHRGDDVSFDELCSFVVMLGGHTEDLYGWEAQLEEGPGGSSDAVSANALTPVYYSPWGERFPTVESVTSLFGLRKGNESRSSAAAWMLHNIQGGPVVEEAGGFKLFLSDKNPTGYMGVRQSGPGRFTASRRSVRENGGDHIHLGTFDTAVEAAIAYAADIHRGEARGERDPLGDRDLGLPTQWPIAPCLAGSPSARAEASDISPRCA